MQDTLISESRIDEIRVRLNIFCNENPSISNRMIANNVGFSSSYISQFRNDKFPTKEKEGEFAIKVESYLNDVELSNYQDKEYHLKFAFTQAAQDIFKMAAYTLRQGEIGVVIGIPGAGRTISLQEYKKRNPNSILIHIIPHITTPRSLLDNICEALKISTDNRKDIMFNEIIDRIAHRLLMIDEGENLNTQGLEIIRRIHDFTNTAS